jgi:hypothetical protein
LAEAGEGTQRTDVAFYDSSTSDSRINLLGDDIDTNIATWLVFPEIPQGVYTGAIFPESPIEVDWSIRPDQRLGFEKFTGNGFPIVADKDIYQFGDASYSDFVYPPYGSCTNNYDRGDMDGYGVTNELLMNADPDCTGNYDLEQPTINEWYNYDNSFEDPYGRDDPGIQFSFTENQANWRPSVRTFESDIQEWGPDTYHTFVATGSTVKFSESQIMSGTSEFWVRSPLDGEYSAKDSFIAIYTVNNMSDNTFSVTAAEVPRHISYGQNWWESVGAPTALGMPVTITPPAGGELVYQSTLGQQDVLLTDYSEMCYFQYQNGTNAGTQHLHQDDSVLNQEYFADTGLTDPDRVSWDPMNGERAYMPGNADKIASAAWNSDTYPYLSPENYGFLAWEIGDAGTVSRGCDRRDYDDMASRYYIGGLDQGYSSWIPDNAWPSAHFTVADGESLQTQRNMDISPDAGIGDYRTYHRANTFLYPNQEYLFIWYLEITESYPTLAITPEDINSFPEDNNTHTFILKGEYNYADPDTNADGIADYLRKPDNLYSSSNTLQLDAGMSFIFTQGQSNDMAGYTIDADNTTMLMFKELPETVKHEAGPDGRFLTDDDEMDYASIYLPFINHENKDITIEYIAWAFEELPGGGYLYKPWYNNTDFGTGYEKHGYRGSYAYYCGERGGLDCKTYVPSHNDPGVEYPGQLDGDAATNQYWAECGDALNYDYANSFKERCFGAPQYNFYYSAFDYYGSGERRPTGYVDHWFGQINNKLDDGTPGAGGIDYPFMSAGNCPASFATPAPGFDAIGQDCLSEANYQPLSTAMNDITQDPNKYRQQYRNFFLHSSSLVPDNGTTHILYMFKFGGHHHWEANLENNRAFGNWRLPMDDLSASGAFDRPYFYSDKDVNRDGRTDGVQDNATKITLLISKADNPPRMVNLELPMWAAGGPGTNDGSCYDDILQAQACLHSAQTDDVLLSNNRELNTYVPIFDLGKCELPDSTVLNLYDPATSVPEQKKYFEDFIATFEPNHCDTVTGKSPSGYIHPRRISIPAEGFIHYNEVWDRNEGTRVDAFELQELWTYSYGSMPCWMPSFSSVCSFTHQQRSPQWALSNADDHYAQSYGAAYAPGIGFSTLGGDSWHHNKWNYAGSLKADPQFGFYNQNPAANKIYGHCLNLLDDNEADCITNGSSWYPHIFCYDVSRGNEYDPWFFAGTTNTYELQGCTSMHGTASLGGQDGIIHFPELNARGASYLRATEQYTVQSEVFASVSITNGRWTESQFKEGDGYTILDPVFHNRIVHNNVYELTIIAHTAEVFEDIEGESSGPSALDFNILSTLNIDIFGAVRGMFDAATEYAGSALDCIGDKGMTACMNHMIDKIVAGIVAALKTMSDAAATLKGNIQSRLSQFIEEIEAIGTLMAEYVLDFVGTIYQMFVEIGQTLDEIAQALLILVAMMIAYGLYFMIMKHGTLIIMALEDL